MTDRINSTISKFPEHLRGDLFNECFIFLHDNPDSTDEDMRLFCRRFVYSLRVDHLSLDKAVSDEEGEQTTFGELLPERVDRESQIDSIIEANRLLKTLKERERLIFDLYYYRDVTVEDIAALYSPLTGIKSENRIYQILSKFKKNEPIPVPEPTERITKLDSTDQNEGDKRQDINKSVHNN